MRLRACTGLLLLASSACAGMPERVRIDVDGRAIEVRQRGLSAGALKGAWSTSSECGGAGAEQREVMGAGGELLILYRCLP